MELEKYYVIVTIVLNSIRHPVPKSTFIVSVIVIVDFTSLSLEINKSFLVSFSKSELNSF